MRLNWVPPVEEAAQRLLDLMQRGNCELVSELVTPDAKVILSAGNERTWADSGFRVLPPVTAALVAGSLLADHDGKSVDACITFPRDEKIWPSGRYRIRFTPDPGDDWTIWRIKSISLISSDSDSRNSK